MEARAEAIHNRQALLLQPLFYKGLHSALCASVKKLVSPTAKIQANDLWQTTVKGWGILQNTGRIRGAEIEG
jgi:hypothetical protein